MSWWPKVDGSWEPIETMPEGEHVLLWWPEGERGVGGMECATVYKDHNPNGEWSYWTHGGPNAGLDWAPRDNERPTHWRAIAPPSESPFIEGSLSRAALPHP
jgi:hypothetical protein